ncbi:hypothetical protein [Streptomyces goshikiensis]|uniref:hypothetical protein n=1 Tax=Streptomyces goshikiensis TaxID=1942 RepID=UPI0033231FFE
MGRDLTLFMVDWEQLRTFPAQDRIEVLDDKAWPWELDDLCALSRGRPDGWLWPPGPGRAWCAEYVFLLVCPPAAVPGKARAWERLEPCLGRLRGPFAAECEGWAGRPDTFEDNQLCCLSAPA